MSDLNRRLVLMSGLAAVATPLRAAPDTAALPPLLQDGGVLVVMRHALAPGTFDPPEFRLGDCRTQRNLSDEGRAQSRRIGEAYRARQLAPARVRSSPWCRCMDTATLAFGKADAWPALGSPRGYDETTNAQSLAALRQAAAEVLSRRGQLEVWVTHMFVISPLLGGPVASGEGLVVGTDGAGGLKVVARIAG